MTLEEIAKLANVSRSTVSRVLNNHPNVRADVRKRVMHVVTEHNFVPNAAARMLVTKRTNVIGLLLPQSARETFADPFFSFLIPSITEACAAHKRYLMLAMITADQEEGFYANVLRAGHMDGLIVGVSLIDDPILPVLFDDPLPIVLLGRHPYYPQAHWVDINNLAAATEIVEHLIERGYRRIANLSLPLTHVAGIDRRDGYKRALLKHRMPIDPRMIIETDATMASGQAAMRQLLELPERPDAVVAASDTVALGALSVIQAAGLRVPEDIAVVGFDDQPSASMSNPPLTTVRQPIGELGSRAVELLIDRIEERQEEPQHLVLPTTMILRQSS